MENITFALPQIGKELMSLWDQEDILLNQATSVIVCSFLEHLNTALNKGITNQTYQRNELVNLINDVQTALRFKPGKES